MRLLLVSNMFPSERNPGYGVFVRNFECSLRDRGVRIDRVVIMGRGQRKIDKLFKYISFSARVFYRALFYRYDCIYVHYIAHSLLPLIPLLFFRRAVLVCNAHGEDLLPRNRVEHSIFRLVKGAVKKSRMIVVPSGYFAQIARNHFPCNEIFISPSAGVDLDIFKPAISVLPSNGSLHIGFVSRIEQGKGWEVLLHAVKRVRDVQPEIALKVSIVGEGSQAIELRSLVAFLELGGVVSYVGALPQSKLPDFYCSLDVFVFPTVLSESLGLVALEALACGIPAICSDIGGIRGYLQDGVNGYLFPPGDSEALAQRIVDFCRLSSEQVSELKNSAFLSAHPYGRARVASDLYSKLVEVVRP